MLVQFLQMEPILILQVLLALIIVIVLTKVLIILYIIAVRGIKKLMLVEL